MNFNPTTFFKEGAETPNDRAFLEGSFSELLTPCCSSRRPQRFSSGHRLAKKSPTIPRRRLSSPTSDTKLPRPGSSTLFSHTLRRKTKGGGRGQRRRKHGLGSSRRGSSRLETDWKIPPGLSGSAVAGSSGPLQDRALRAKGLWARAQAEDAEARSPGDPRVDNTLICLHRRPPDPPNPLCVRGGSAGSPGPGLCKAG